MKDVHQIVEQVELAQNDREYADEFIMNYLPFIKSEASKFTKQAVNDGNDELSIAMLSFHECIMSYKREKGNFLSFCSVAIRNRLIDYYRSERKHIENITLHQEEDDEFEFKDSKNEPEMIISKLATRKEIFEFAQQLQQFGLTLSDVSENCPRQDRTMSLCMQVLDYAKTKPVIIEELLKGQRLPLKMIVEGAKVDRKTVERHRSYIVAILLAYTNGYEIIRNHLSLIRPKESGQL